jgi:hypothetical protein
MLARSIKYYSIEFLFPNQLTYILYINVNVYMFWKKTKLTRALFFILNYKINNMAIHFTLIKIILFVIFRNILTKRKSKFISINIYKFRIKCCHYQKYLLNNH